MLRFGAIAGWVEAGSGVTQIILFCVVLRVETKRVTGSA
jgi:hypothetical protein